VGVIVERSFANYYRPCHPLSMENEVEEFIERLDWADEVVAASMAAAINLLPAEDFSDWNDTNSYLPSDGE
jgi:hypothetical protein